MPTVSRFDGIKIKFYFDEHPPPHFHAGFPEYEAQIDIETFDVMSGDLPYAKLKLVRAWAAARKPLLRSAWAVCRSDGDPREDRMTKHPLRIASAEPVIHGVLKVVWDDGYEGVVDLRPVIARGRVFLSLEDPELFRAFQVEEYGHSIGWVDQEGVEIDFGAESLRKRAQEQADVLLRAS